MILDEILAHKRAEVAAHKARVPLAEIRARAEALHDTRDFADALQREHVALIAEIKRASPSRGALNANADPAQIAQVHAAHGAAAISVLTDAKYFGGALDDLVAARAGTRAPLLRKDFIVDAYQVFEARASGADAILLIARALDDAPLRDYRALAETLGMRALVEIHNERELDRALAAGAHIIGINNRNLADFTVDLATTELLAPRILSAVEGSKEKIIVAESGIATRADVARVACAGAHAVLVGEALMRAEDVGAKARELANVKRERVY